MDSKRKSAPVIQLCSSFAAMMMNEKRIAANLTNAKRCIGLEWRLDD
jgi:hypothetical protein